MSDPNNPNGDYGFSAEEQAALDAFETGGLSAALSELGEVEPEISAEELENFKENSIEAMETEIERKPEDSVEEGKKSVVDGQAEEDEESEHKSETDSESDDKEEAVSEVFVDGPSGKKIKVDLKPSEDKLIKLHQAADRARLYQSQLDKMKHEAQQTEEKIVDLNETAQLFNQLEELSENLDYKDPSSFNDVVSVLTEGELTMDDLIEKAVQERDYLNDLSDDALSLYEERKQIRREKRELEKAKQRKTRDEDKSRSEHDSRMRKEQETMIFNAFLKHDIRGQLGDQSRENGIMERAWNESIRKLGNFEEVTPEAAEEVFKSEIDFFSGPREAEVSKKVDSVVKKRSANATKKAQKVVAPNKPTSREEIEAFDSIEEAFANWNNIKL